MRAHSCLLLVAAAAAVALCGQSTGVQAQNAVAVATLRGRYSLEGMTVGGTSSLTNITLTVNGLPQGTYGTHIHAYGDVSTGLTAENPTINTNTSIARGIGTHFNPAGVPHACFPNATRHVGDIGNIVSDGSPTQTFNFMSELMSLNDGANGIVGRSVAIHSGVDKCYDFQPTGSSGAVNMQGVIGVADPSKYGYSAGATSSSVLTTNPVSAIAVIRNTQLYTAGTIFGTAQFGFDSTTGKVRVVLSATGLPPNSAHGFHIHTYGDDTDGKGTNAGTHFSPIAGATHQLPPSPTRHVGDMGIVTSDASGAINADVQFDLLQLIPGVAPNAYSIIGRAVMIHNMTDDGVTAGTGNAGARFAIGVIGISNRPMPPPAAGGSSSTGTSGGNIPDQTPPKAGTPTGATLCDRLTTALGQQVTAAGTANALSTYVQKAFYGWTNQVGLYNSPITGGYFNGQLQYRYAGDPSSIILARAFAADGSNLVSPDFNADSVQLNALVNSLTNFFGQKEVLDCTAAPATYTGSNNMYAVHQRMNITQGVFSAFNDILVQTAGAYGLTADDAAALLAGLNSFGRNGATMTNEICTDSKCACATGYDGDACDHSTLGAASSVVVSIASLMIAAVVATVAQQL